MKNYAVRNKETGDLISTHDDPVEAKYSITDPETQEVAEKIIKNIYRMFPNGRSYIVGTEIKWQRYDN